jgi:hypothetical protein
MKYTIQDCTPGTSWAAQFRVTTWLDHTGTPVDAPQDVQVGASADASIGEYESLGVITTRDLAQELVELTDTQTLRRFVVSHNDIWEIDQVEWRD